MKNTTIVPLLLALACASVLAGCSFQNKYERQADAITRAVIANNMQPVISDFSANAKRQVTLIKVAELSTELRDQGKYEGLKETKKGCRTGFHCFIAKFAKNTYTERMRLDSGGKVAYWWTHAAELQR